MGGKKIIIFFKVYFFLSIGWSARKSLEVVKNVEYILAVELMAACQAIDLIRPLKSTKRVEKMYEKVRKIVPYME